MQIKTTKKKMDMSYSQTKKESATGFIKKLLFAAVILISFGSVTARGNTGVDTPPKAAWSFNGPFVFLNAINYNGAFRSIKKFVPFATV